MKKISFLFITLLLAALCAMTICAEDKIVMRWDFEDNNLNSIGTADGNDEDGYYGFGELAIVEGGANGTKYGLKIPGVEVGNGQHLNGLEPDTTYTISFWGKVLNAQPESWPNFGVNNYDEFGSYLTVWQYTEEWAQYSITFTTGFETTTAMPYTWTYGPGSCDFYIDEVIVYTGDLDKALAAEAAAKEPVVEEPVVEEPVVEEPVVEEPAIEEPVIEEPVVEAPKTADLAVMLAAAAVISCGTAIVSNKKR